MADVLDGTENPGGKLPVTVPRSVGQVPLYYNHKVGSGYTDGADGMAAGILSGGYVNEPGTPLYPFGFGLSYTSFALEELKLDGAQLPTDGQLAVSCRVTNTGSRAGSEVVQLYTHFLDAHVTRPNKSLGSFARVWLQPGESRKVTFRLSMAQLGYYNENMDFVTEPGELQVMVGTSAHDLPLRNQRPRSASAHLGPAGGPAGSAAGPPGIQLPGERGITPLPMKKASGLFPLGERAGRFFLSAPDGTAENALFLAKPTGKVYS